MALFKNSREFFFQGTPPLTPPCFEKIDPPLAEKKVDPLPWAEGACPPMHPTTASAEQSENEKIFQRGNFSWSPEENPELDLPILSDDDDEVSL